MKISAEQLPAHLAADDYLRQRLAPSPGDPLYLHLADLLEALKTVAADAPIRVLDFGAGGSPYRSLFPNADYKRADLPGDATLDFHIDSNGTVDAPSASFDLVLSTQVLEHVRYPPVYFSECQRLLRPGGMLVLSTHGMFEDHGCPYDFRRWTSDGLKHDLSDSGFESVQVSKLTSGGRAVIFLGVSWFHLLHQTTHKGWHRLLRVVTTLVHKARPMLNRLADRLYPLHSVADATQSPSTVYVAVFATGLKPAGEISSAPPHSNP
ncbi:methyltransferase domain-containing protein [Verrucomicrobium sp. BvORR034]|uniref:class I SAM-dependent methyltransferase n=1 Tax=Verrucomicrobium sp. BvORR034 TaxID=1396418 RepID=UPI00067953FE|nr:methyltransferase domain-containing protein [Verrucomicrobium sp. BvORR034]